MSIVSVSAGGSPFTDDTRSTEEIHRLSTKGGTGGVSDSGE